MSGGFLFQAVIYLTAAMICVPILKRLGMSSVLGYLAAGILIGPFVLGFIGDEGSDIMHIAEFGVVLMLFLIGLELEPSKFWLMRRLILGMGSLQLIITSIIVFAAALLLGFTWQAAVATGFAVAMSSTAIELQYLKEKGLMNTSAGRSSLSVLLFQDVAVIPILALLPLLAIEVISLPEEGKTSLIDDLPRWMQTLSVLLSVGVIILSGKYVIVPLLKMIAGTRLRELFVAAALLIVFSIVLLMEIVGLSPALGAFLGGVVLANSEFRHELESDLEPFKGLLLGLFFMAVGASIDFTLIFQNPLMIFIIVAGIMFLKALVLLITGKIFRLSSDQNLLFALGLSQIGEFSFILYSYMGDLKILDEKWVGILMAVTAITMTITPVFLLINERLIAPRFGIKEADDKEMDTIDEKSKVIIAGFSHFGSTIGRFLRANGVKATILDNDSEMVDLLRKLGFKVYYGDATRTDLLESAGAADAKLLILAVNSINTSNEIINNVKKHFPELEVMVRVKNRFEAYDMIENGIKSIYRESLDTSVRMGMDALVKLGSRRYTAFRAAQNFLRYDEQALEKLAVHRHDKKEYIASAREAIETQEELLKGDVNFDPKSADHAWDSEQLREVLKKES
ncbi:MAG: cation:proton antiporter [Bacteroidetes bacterium]|nr:cation:proton antiporter [Bacteroidota bacterium]